MNKRIKNIDTVAHSWGGVYLEPNTFYDCQTQTEVNMFFSSDSFLTALTEGKAQVFVSESLIAGVANSIKALSTTANLDGDGNTLVKNIPFSSKTLNGKAIFKRIHGVQNQNTIGLNTIEFLIPYLFCKITGVEVVGGFVGDIVDFEVYDTPTGAISGYPNVKLNQFGFSVCIAKDFYSHTSEYESDLPQNIKLVVKYTATTANLAGINFILNEVK